MNPTQRMVQVALSLRVLWPEDVAALDCPITPMGLLELKKNKLLEGRVTESLQPVLKLAKRAAKSSAEARRSAAARKSSAGTATMAKGSQPRGTSGTGTATKLREAPVDDLGSDTLAMLAAAEAFFAAEDGEDTNSGLVPLGPGDSLSSGTHAALADFDPAALRSRSRAFDPDLLPKVARGVLDQAALVRALWGRGLLTRDVVETLLGEANARGMRLAELIRQRDLVSASDLRVESPAPVCGSCLTVHEVDFPDSAPCAKCGDVLEPISDTATLAGSQGSARFTAIAGTPRPSGRLRTDEAFSAGGSFANYELLHRIAEGGMGVVFKARERSLNRLVALKIMRGGALSSEAARARFLAEAEAAAALDHPDIVPIHHVGELDGYPYYTMDYVEGLPLDQWVENSQPAPRAIATLIQRVAQAVHHFHLRGIIHRDLKPDNVLVTDKGEPRIIDFGIAKQTARQGINDTTWTLDGEILGTPHYMSPEQAAGRQDQIDTRCDVYAVGAILYQLLGGKRPYHELRPAQILSVIGQEDPNPLVLRGDRADRDLEAIVGMAMARERDRRYQSARELADDLGRYLAHSPIVARRAGWTDRARKVARRHPTAVALLAAALCVALASVAWFLRERQLLRADLQERLATARRAEPLERVHLLSGALALAPDDEVIIAEKRAAEIEVENLRERSERAEERKEAEREREKAEQRRLNELRLAEERSKAEIAEAKLAKNKLEEAARVREQTEARVRAQAAEKARSKLEQARAAKTDLEALGPLSDGLALVGEGDELGGELAKAKVARCLSLARWALDHDEALMASYWLDEAGKLRAARAEQSSIATLKSAVLARSQGLDLLAEARAAIRDEKWLLARDKLALARSRGVSGKGVEDDEGLVAERCRAAGLTHVEKAHVELQAGELHAALAQARAASELLGEGDATSAELVETIAARLVRENQREVAAGWETAERRAGFVSAQTDLVHLLKGTKSHPVVRREVALRSRLLLDAWLTKETFVLPELSELRVGPLLVQRHEVTNQAFKAFVRAGGYRDQELWDPAAWARVKDMLDGSESPQPGPRTWRGGSYGEASNGQRPVRGVSFYEARAYARWLSKKTGQRWRLPTAAEWRAAATWDPTSGEQRAYPWGQTFLAAPFSTAHKQAPRVGSVDADRSPLGGTDFAASVSEWVVRADGAPGIKGASFAIAPATAQHLARAETTGRSAPFPPRELGVTIGFRLVMEPSR